MNILKCFSVLFFLVFSYYSPAQVIRQSGNQFLSSEMLKLQNDPNGNPTVLWIDQGQELWNANCAGCHQNIKGVATAVVRYPVLKSKPDQAPKIWNIEDQIIDCFGKISQESLSTEHQNVLALSILLSDVAKGMSIHVDEPTNKKEKQLWQEQMSQGAAIYTRRQGRLNLSCTQCHDQNIGKNLRSDIVSPAYVTGFPIYRQSWQTVGSIDRRLRACYSGVQASVPSTKSSELRALELFLKKRSDGMLWDGPSIRR